MAATLEAVLAVPSSEGKGRRTIAMNRRRIRFLSLFVLTLLAQACVATEGPGPEPDNPPADTIDLLPEKVPCTLLTGIPYASDGNPCHLMDVYLPDDSGTFPALLFVHGGGWTGGDRTEFQGMAEFYAKRGIAGFTIDYRIAAPGSPSWPDVILDVITAAEHIREHAAAYRVDPGRMGAVGFSAGGHLASLLGTLSGSGPFPEGLFPADISSSPGPLRLVVDYAGPTDLEFIALQGATSPRYAKILALIETFLGSDYASDPTTWREASPASYVSPGDPVFVIAHGAQDDVVPVATSQTFASMLQDTGVETHLVILEQAGHGFNEQQNMAVRHVLEPIMARLLFR